MHSVFIFKLLELKNELILVLVAVAITHFLISKIGASLSQIDGITWKYVTFNFEDDRKKPITANVLMNVFIPNIAMIFLYQLSIRVAPNVTKIIWIYVVGYYMYRFILITFLLRRKELYSAKYELSIAFWGIGLALLICYSFLLKSENWFISVDEMREELWFALIVFAYGLIKDVISKRIVQEDVLSQESVDRYIINKFKKYYLKYKMVLDDVNKNDRLLVFLLAIMVYEDYNRGPLKRILEYIKILICGESTVTIMQVRSNKIITDSEGIKIAYTIINDKYHEFLADNGYVDAFRLALGYNPSDEYASNVEYIDSIIFQEINDHRSDYKDIKLDNYEAGNLMSSEYNQNKYGECKIISSPNIISGLLENENVRIRRNVDNEQLEVVIKDIYDRSLHFSTENLFNSQTNTCVISIENCRNIKINGIKISGRNKCNGISNVGLRITDSSEIMLENVRIEDCTYAIVASDSSIHLDTCTISNCINGGIEGFQSEALLENTDIIHCYITGDYLLDGQMITLNNTRLVDNDVKISLINAGYLEMQNVTIKDNRYLSSYLESREGATFIGNRYKVL